MNRISPADRFRSRIRSQLKVGAGAGILVGVSGGIDSTVLLHVLVALGYKCRVLHINHGLRAEEAAEDALLVEENCRAWGVPCEIEDVDAAARAVQTGESFQMAARHLRYGAFIRYAEAHDIHYVAVGHNLNDQAETVILNLSRGTGPEGVAGMRASRPLNKQVSLLRPLLRQSRDSIAAYAHELALSWREDVSNQDESFMRVRLRRKVMPHLDAAALARSAYLMQNWVDQVLRPVVSREFNAAAGCRRLSVGALADLPPVLAGRVIVEGLRHWLPEATATHDLVKRILHLVGQQAGRKVEISGGAVWRGRRGLIFASEASAGDHYGGYLSTEQEVALPQGHLSLQVSSKRPASLRHLRDVWVDGGQFQLPLRVRRWRAGDYIRPLGLTGRKKVSDVLTDRAVPVDQRSDQFVVCSGEDIVWLVGHCINNEYRVTSATRVFVRFRLNGPIQKKVLFKNAAEIQSRVQALGRTLATAYKGKRPLIVVLLKGAFVFAADLVRAMGITVEVEFWGLSSYGDTLESSGSVTEVLPLSCDVTGRHVIIVEDIVDTGRTVAWARSHLGQQGAASVAVVTLLHARDCAVSVDHAGFATDRYFVAGYGLDVAQEMRNLPDLYYLKSAAENK